MYSVVSSSFASPPSSAASKGSTSFGSSSSFSSLSKIRSILLATITNARPSCITSLAMWISCRCKYWACASSTKTTTSATLIARNAFATDISSTVWLAREYVEVHKSSGSGLVYPPPPPPPPPLPYPGRCLILRMPAVSTNWIGRPFQDQSTAIASRVKPGVEPVITLSCCKIVFTNVDFPTLGRPTIANCNGFSSTWSSCESGSLSAVANIFMSSSYSSTSSDWLPRRLYCSSSMAIKSSECCCCCSNCSCCSSSLSCFSVIACSIIIAISAIPSPCAADIGIAEPNPKRNTSSKWSLIGDSSSYNHWFPSNLFANITIFGPFSFVAEVAAAILAAA